MTRSDSNSGSTARFTVVIAGNPNTGKTTIFNQLTGGRAKVGNYPGITVSRHEGRLRLDGGEELLILDSPGTYSLSARSRDELLALQAIAGLPPLARPDLVVAVVDASQLNRNLYLVLQIIELGLPVVVGLNMIDMLPELGVEIDVEALGQALGVPVVPLVGRKNIGTDRLVEAMTRVLKEPVLGQPGWRWVPTSEALLSDLTAVEGQVPSDWTNGGAVDRRALTIWSLISLDDEDELTAVPEELRQSVRVRRALAQEHGRSIDREIIEGRYDWIDEQAPRFLKDAKGITSLTERIDRIALNPLLGFTLFLGLMVLVFQSLFTWTDPVIRAIETLFAWCGARVLELLPTGFLSSFVVDGLIGGVGAFVVFLPQILLLFLLIGIMEDTGYMARVAVLMDRIMKMLGLHGRAFVPMISGFACAVPAIMATRTMERRRDRLLTMMALPFMTCSARLPVYGLLIAAISTRGGSGFQQGLLMAAMYLFGTLSALVCAFVLGRTVLKGKSTPLLIELPPYRVPHWPSVLRMMWEQTRAFVQKAGTIILVCSIGMWLLLSFPNSTPDDSEQRALRTALETRLEQDSLGIAERKQLEAQLGVLSAGEAGERARNSYAGRLGRFLEPVLEPLGFDWKIGVGIIGAFAAREVFVSTMGVVYGVGEDASEESPALRDRLSRATWPDGRKVFTPLACLSLLIFFALACQCMSTLAVVRLETGSWVWPLFLLTYMTTVAWLASFAVYQGGRALGFG
ncbi:MAG: ferrous iron transport protein B [Planctomycetota bacterium]